MSISVWPADLPLPTVDFTGEPQHSTISSSGDAASIVRRRRFGGPAPVALSVGWVLSIAQYRAFKTFFNTEISNGAAVFTLELRFPKNTALTEWRVRFDGQFEATYVEGNWTIAAKVQLLFPTTLAELARRTGYGAFLVQPGPDRFMLADGYQYSVQI